MWTRSAISLAAAIDSATTIATPSPTKRDRIRAAKAHNQIGRLHEARIVRNGLEPVGNVVGAGEDSQCARHRQGCRFVHRANACMSVG